MIRRPIPAHILRLIEHLNACLRELHDAGDQVVVAVAHVTVPGDARTLSQLHVDLLVPEPAESIAADVAVLPISRPELVRSA